MMTIKEFARLCACGTQTLRYYDKIDLLKPVKVDPCSGYRYYDPAQAIDFVKIKNLQAADFTINEIKVLLTKSDEQVYEAFSLKIAEQKEKLERIREIQQSYLTEKTMMEKIVHSVSDYILSHCRNLEALREFGLTPEDAPQVLARLRTYFNQLIQPSTASGEVTLAVNDEITQGGEQVLERLNSLTEENLSDTILLGDAAIAEDSDFDPSDHVSLWEQHGWEHIYEFIDDIPTLEAGHQYCFWVHLKGDQYKGDLSFPMFLLGAALLKQNVTDIPLSVSCERSEDGENHFKLMRKK